MNLDLLDIQRPHSEVYQRHLPYQLIDKRLDEKSGNIELGESGCAYPSCQFQAQDNWGVFIIGRFTHSLVTVFEVTEFVSGSGE